jgi:hypothetical protein
MKEKKMANFSKASHNTSERFIDIHLPATKEPEPIIAHNSYSVNRSRLGL